MIGANEPGEAEAFVPLCKVAKTDTLLRSCAASSRRRFKGKTRSPVLVMLRWHGGIKKE